MPVGARAFACLDLTDINRRNETMTLLRAAAALAIVGFLAACGSDVTSGRAPVGAPADPMTDSGLSPDPMNPGEIDDSVGTQI